MSEAQLPFIDNGGNYLLVPDFVMRWMLARKDVGLIEINYWANKNKGPKDHKQGSHSKGN